MLIELAYQMGRSLLPIPPSAFILFMLVLVTAMMMSKSLLHVQFISKAYTKYLSKNTFQKIRRPKSMKSLCTVTGEQDITEKKWDIKSLKLEVNRVYMRTFKKVGQANERLSKALIEYDNVINDPNASMKRMEDCPNPEALQTDLNTLKDKLTKLIYLEEELKSVKSVGNEKFPALADLAVELGVSDVSPPVQERGPKKIKAKAPTGPRKPYLVYSGSNGIEIRVGRGASDNDELSCNPAHRDGPDWWLHVAGVPGSHVVIRSHDDLLPEKYPEALLDAALLAVINSKGSQSGRVPVTFTRCRFVTKPGGAKPGLVYLSGEVSTIKIDVRAEGPRLERLEKNKEGITA